MVKLTEVEDEAFQDKQFGDEVLLADDDDDFTDTDSEISDTDIDPPLDETLTDRIYALKDIIPPKTRATISSYLSTLSSATSTGITYGGKGLWVLATSVLVLGIPYALSLGEEQMYQDEERQRMMAQEGAGAMMQGGEGDGREKPL